MELIKTKKIAVVGAGGWGKDHIRTFADLGCLSGIINSNEMDAYSYHFDNTGITG